MYTFPQLQLTQGYQTDTANNGQEAVDKVLYHEPCLFDLVLMDLRMPVMDGITATRKIREVPYLRDLPIIAVSAEVGDEIKDIVTNAGCNCFLEKPVQSAILSISLNKYLKRCSVKRTKSGNELVTIPIF